MVSDAHPEFIPYMNINSTVSGSSLSLSGRAVTSTDTDCDSSPLIHGANVTARGRLLKSEPSLAVPYSS